MASLRKVVKTVFPQVTALARVARRMRRWLRGVRLSVKSREHVFTEYFQSNQWGDRESRSGRGSNLKETMVVREVLPGLVRELEIVSILDLPCGDFHWMREVDLGSISYIGGDIVEPLIVENAAQYAGTDRRFLVLDMCTDDLPQADLIFCRDALVHLSDVDALAAIANFKSSGARYLLTTTFPEVTANADIVTGMWRPLNLCREPFCFPEPMRLYNERYEGQHGRYRDKSVALWRIDTLP